MEEVDYHGRASMKMIFQMHRIETGLLFVFPCRRGYRIGFCVLGRQFGMVSGQVTKDITFWGSDTTISLNTNGGSY